MNKWFMFLIVSMLLVTSISADLSFDNVKEYNEEEKQVTIKDNFGLSDISVIRLLTPLNNVVGVGEDVKVAEFYLWVKQDYNDAFNKMDFYDIKDSMKEINRNFTYKYKVMEEINTPNMTFNCSKNTEQEIKEGNCDYYQVGTYKQLQEKWYPLEDFDFRENEILTIGIFTNTINKESIEWIPEMFGVRIEEFASWNSTFEVDLFAYYKLNDSYDSTGNFDLTSLASSPDNHTGIIGDGKGNDGTSNKGYTLSTKPDEFLLNNTDQDFTVGYWINVTTTASSGTVFSTRYNSGVYIQFHTGNGDIRLVESGQGVNSRTDSPVVANKWYFVVHRKTGTNLTHFINGTITASDTISSTLDGYDNAIGGENFMAESDGSIPLNGVLDEMFWYDRALTDYEISYLYNDHSGLSYGDTEAGTPPNVTIINPSNTTYITQTVDFKVTVEDTDEEDCNYTFNNGVTNYTMTNVSNNWTSQNNSMNDGTFEVFYHCWDYSGEINNTESIVFTVNATAPNINITYPINETYHKNQSLNIDFTFGDAQDCWWSNDTGITNYSLWSCENITNGYWSEDYSNAKVITVWGNNSNNIVGSDSVTFYIDISPPSFISGVTTYNDVSFNTSFLIWDASGLATMVLNDTSVFKNDSTGRIYNVTSLASPKYYLLNISSSDVLGNNNTIIVSINITERIGDGTFSEGYLWNFIDTDSNYSWTDIESNGIFLDKENATDEDWGQYGIWWTNKTEFSNSELMINYSFPTNFTMISDVEIESYFYLRSFNETNVTVSCYNGNSWSEMYFWNETGENEQKTFKNYTDSVESDCIINPIQILYNFTALGNGTQRSYAVFYEDLVKFKSNQVNFSYWDSDTDTEISPICTDHFSTLVTNPYTIKGTTVNLTCVLENYITETQEVSLISGSLINVTLNPKLINLTFYDYDGNLEDVAGYYSNGIETINFTGKSIEAKVSNLYDDFVKIVFGFNTTIMNYSQFYEFDKSWISSTYENLTLLEESDKTVYIKVVDESNNPIDDVLVRTAYSDPTREGNYSEIGQRITGAYGVRGTTFFYYDDDTDINLRFTKDGYDAFTIESIDVGSVDFPDDDPLIVTLITTEFAVYKGVSVAGFTFYNNNMTCIPITIYAPSRSSAKFTTDYITTNISVDLDKYKFGIANLTRGTHYCSSCTNDLNVTIYIDDIHWGSFIIPYEAKDNTRFIEPTGLDTETKRRLAWIGLLAITSILGLLIKSDEDADGSGSKSKVFFLIGCALLPILLNGDMIFMLVIPVLYSIGIILKKWNSE